MLLLLLLALLSGHDPYRSTCDSHGDVDDRLLEESAVDVVVVAAMKNVKFDSLREAKFVNQDVTPEERDQKEKQGELYKKN